MRSGLAIFAHLNEEYSPAGVSHLVSRILQNRISAKANLGSLRLYWWRRYCSVDLDYLHLFSNMGFQI